MQLDCPCCGPRDLREFLHVGDAWRASPALSDDAEVWAGYVYARRNPRGAHLEYWQHLYGCRQVLKVRRDTLTHVIEAVDLVGPHAPAGAR